MARSTEGRRCRRLLCQPDWRAASSTSSSIQRRRSRIRRAIPLSARRCRGRMCRRNASARHIYMHDFAVPNMVHARVIRPPANGAKLVSVDESSIKNFPGAKVVRMKDFLAVVADDEWTAVLAARALHAQWSEWTGLPSQRDLVASLRAEPGIVDETLVNKGNPARYTARRRQDAYGHLLLADAESRFNRPVLRHCRCARGRCDGVDRVARHARKSRQRLPSFSACRRRRCG